MPRENTIAEFHCPLQCVMDGEVVASVEVLWRRHPDEPDLYQPLFRDRASGEWRPAAIHFKDKGTPWPKEGDVAAGDVVFSGTEFDAFVVAAKGLLRSAWGRGHDPDWGILLPGAGGEIWPMALLHGRSEFAGFHRREGFSAVHEANLGPQAAYGLLRAELAALEEVAAYPGAARPERLRV